VIIDSARKAITELCRRAALIWGVPEEGVTFRGRLLPAASSNVATFRRCRRRDCRQDHVDARRYLGHSEMNVTGAGRLRFHIVDVEVDQELGRVDIKRYTVVEDAGKAIHRLQVEGQYQGGAVQGIGWALNEEYIYGETAGCRTRASSTIRMPVAIRRADDRYRDRRGAQSAPSLWLRGRRRGAGDAHHGAASPTPSAAAIGVRPRSLPMSPPKLLKLIEEARAAAVDPYQMTESNSAFRQIVWTAPIVNVQATFSRRVARRHCQHSKREARELKQTLPFHA